MGVPQHTQDIVFIVHIVVVIKTQPSPIFFPPEIESFVWDVECRVIYGFVFAVPRCVFAGR